MRKNKTKHQTGSGREVMGRHTEALEIWGASSWILYPSHPPAKSEWSCVERELSSGDMPEFLAYWTVRNGKLLCISPFSLRVAYHVAIDNWTENRMYLMGLLLGLNEIAIIKQLAPDGGTLQLNSTVVSDWTVCESEFQRPFPFRGLPSRRSRRK